MKFICAILTSVTLSTTSSCAFYPIAAGAGCFVKGTVISTPSGPRPIESLTSGDEVFSWDEETKQLVIGIVDVVVRRHATPWSVALSNGIRLGITPDHPVFLMESQNWVPVEKVMIGDTVGFLDVEMQALENVRIDSMRQELPPQTTYNLKVRRYQNSFAEGLLAHFY